MTWREEFVARVLLLVAAMFAEDAQLAANIKTLANSLTTAKYDERNRRAA